MSSIQPDPIGDLTSPDPQQRIAAAQRLARMNTPDPAAAAPLVGLLDGPFDDELFAWVETALEVIQPPADQIPAFLQWIDQFLQGAASPETAYWSATMLGKLKSASPESLQSLTNLLERSDHPTVPARAAWALGEIGPPARTTLPHLRIASHSPIPKLASFAQHAIRQIKGQALL